MSNGDSVSDARTSREFALSTVRAALSRLQPRDQILEAFLFGSIARDEGDDASDVDVLVVTNELNDEIRAYAESLTKELANTGKPFSVSVYDIKRLSQLAAFGSLFLWHLFLEAISIWRHPTAEWQLPAPSRHADPLRSLSRFQGLLRSGVAQLQTNPQNVVFEAGLQHVAARNTGVIGSHILLPAPLFGRLAAPLLSERIAVRFPVDAESYDLLVRCKVDPDRYRPAPNVQLAGVLQSGKALLEWTEAVTALVRRSLGEG